MHDARARRIARDCAIRLAFPRQRGFAIFYVDRDGRIAPVLTRKPEPRP
jgi:hypothetical protein